MYGDYDIVSHMTRFCRVLRSHGMLVGPREASDAVRALGVVDMMDQGRVYWTLRTVLVSRCDELPVFDYLFQRFWDFEQPLDVPPGGPPTDQFGLTRDFKRRPPVMGLPDYDSDSQDTLVQVLRSGASANHVLTDRDLTGLRSDELSELSRIAARMVRALASRPGRRRKRHRRKGDPDLRGAFRLGLATGGDPVRLPRLKRVQRVPRLLVLLDVSGSMDRHAQLLLQLVYAVYQHTKRVETFVFSTDTTRVTRELKAPSFGEALSRISALVKHWSGGTRIGESLASVNTRYEALEDRYTTVFLLSDGWETGDPEHLGREMRRMQRRVRNVIWLNPLIGTPDYEMQTRGLEAAKPYVDHFVSAKDVAHLKRLPQLIRS